MLSEDEKESMRTRLVELVLDVRRAYFQTPSPNVLKHWDQLQGSLRASARTTGTVEEFASRFVHRMRVRGLSKDGSQTLTDLVAWVREHDATSGFFDLIDREHTYVMALAKLTVEKRKESAS